MERVKSVSSKRKSVTAFRVRWTKILLYVTHAGLYVAEKHEETLGCKGSKNQKKCYYKGEKKQAKVIEEATKN